MSQLPSFESASYKSQAPLWQYLDDLYTGSESWITRHSDGSCTAKANSKTYLPKFSKESDADYLARLVRTPYSDRFAAAIRDFVGLILHNGVRFSADHAGASSQIWFNLNGRGLDGLSFLSEIAIAVMRRGHGFVMVESPRSGGLPYWVHVHAHQVLSWRHVEVNGRPQLIQVVIRQAEMVSEGLFGERLEVSYRVLTPGRYDVYTIHTDEKTQKQTAVYHADRSGVMGCYKGGTFYPYEIVPLFCIYGGTQTGLFESDPQLKSLADLNHTHYQMYSDHLSKIHLCCFPVAVRIGSMGNQDDLVLGPGVIVDAPPGGSFVWAEPGSSSIEQSRKEIEALESAMDFLGIQYLVKPSDRQAAAVSLIQAAKVESSLELFTRSFVASLNEAWSFTLSTMGEPENPLDLDTKFFAQGASDPNLISALTSLFVALPSLSPQLAPLLLDLLQRRGFLPSDFDLKQFTDIEEETQTNGRSTATEPTAAVSYAAST